MEIGFDKEIDAISAERRGAAKLRLCPIRTLTLMKSPRLPKMRCPI